jgi:hypothetical protein
MNEIHPRRVRASRAADLRSWHAEYAQALSVRCLLKALSDLANPPRIIVGGHPLVEHAARQSFGAGCLIARDVIEGLDFAQQFLRRHPHKVVLKEYLSALGRTIRDLRLKKGWTQEQLAEGGRVSRVCIFAVEGASRTFPWRLLSAWRMRWEFRRRVS